MNVKLLGFCMLFVVGGMQAADITLAEWGDLTGGNQFDLRMLCRKNTDVTNTTTADARLKGPYNWYIEKENELYGTYHNQNNQKVYFLGNYVSPQIVPNTATKKISKFKQDPDAAPAECRMYMIVRYQ